MLARIGRPRESDRRSGPAFPAPGAAAASPAVERERKALLDGGDHGGGVAHGIERQAGGVGPDELGVLVRFGVDRLAVPGAGGEDEPDPGVAGSGVALVDRQDMAERGRVKGDPGLFAGFADGRVDDALTVFQVT